MSDVTTLEKTQENEQTKAKHIVKPRYEVSSDDAAYYIEVYMPGVAKEGVSITLDHAKLIIEGMRLSHAKEHWRAQHREIGHTDFRLDLDLNLDVNEEEITANTINGVLRITLPIAEKAKPRVIAVS